MLRIGLRVYVIGVLALAMVNAALADATGSSTRKPNEYGWFVEPSRTMQADGIEWAHNVQIALPRSYYTSDKEFPVLWLTDGYGYFQIAMQTIGALASTGEGPETIIVSVGPPPGTDPMEFQLRRSFDFGPAEEMLFDGPGADAMRKAAPEGLVVRSGGASAFLDFLVDKVRPAIAKDYRIRADQQTLFGHSGGGMFVGFAIFKRPGTFESYICGSPSLNSGNFTIFDMEAEYAAANSDFPISIFYGAGEPEILAAGLSDWGLVSSLVRLAEGLHIRRYPSLKQKVRIYPDRNHLTVVPELLTDGLRWIAEGRASGD